MPIFLAHAIERCQAAWLIAEGHVLQYAENDAGVVGHDDFLDELYADHATALKFFAMRLSAGDRYSAEDIMQETMLRAWRHADSLRRSGLPVRPWLFAVARRLVIDAKRRRDTRPHEVAYPSDFAADRFLEEGFDAVITRDEVVRALDSLTPAQRDIIISIHYLGLPVAEVARTLGIPEGTVKSRTHYIVRALRSRLLPDPEARSEAA